ncbi:alpha-L-fucosidase [Mariniphaga anaerophila]|uniref:alpha-L-fucosidase n=1 Tax=Mariniphaga anaerophila TaxID=1484053 RepID=A0A1M5GIJ0_9BACT|nr:alpha-L-fucosidase [Mariniphaga anaerophila]SHG03342.1 alpha-L-fucosidase [Mariniphaga anaerophila]
MKHPVLLLLIFVLFSCEKTLPPEPVLPLPSERQLAWHELEFYAFVHFNMNTFTNMEWGFGNENPKLFNPTELDCRQWARVCKDAGMKGIILTAKHHDGFCLWPSEYTEHSVKNSDWKNGKGDVVRELSDACREYGLKFGVYLSPWDRNHSDYGNPEYLDYFRNQLRELLTNYGDVFEVWFDGANGGSGWYGGANEERRIDRETYYDWENTYKIVRELQPEACLFSDAGPDIRWVGNEEGWAMETNWAPIRRDEFYPGSPNYVELRTGHEDGTHWVPAEVDVSIRPGWYYHASEDHQVKTLPHLLDIYYNSIGRNASLLINFPVDTRGLIHEKDVEQVMKLANAIKNDFANNLALNKRVSATNIRGNSRSFKAGNAVDGNPDTYWTTDDGVIQSSLEIDFREPVEMNRFLVQEDIRLGQRVKQFKLEALVGNNWQTIARETTIGRKRILRFPNISASKLRLSIEDAKASPVISTIEVYKAPKVLAEPIINRNKNGMVSIKAFDSGLHIYYTTDGENPSENSLLYNEAFEWKKKGIIKALAVDAATGSFSPVSVAEFDVVKEKWKVVGELASAKGIENIFDGDESSAWSIEANAPVDVVIDLGESLAITGFNYLPDQGRWNPGIIFNYEFFVSEDGKNWGAPVSSGEFSNIKNSPIWQKKHLDTVQGRFIRLRALSSALEEGRIGIAEFGINTN